MITDIRLPDLHEGTAKEELRQIRSYLYQLAGQLQYALGSVNQAQLDTRQQLQAMEASQSPAASFGSLKSLIIKSADIVQAYTEEITRRLEGVYVAQSAFGIYTQETAQQITENAEGVLRSFENQQQILGKLSGIESSVLDVSAYVKTGCLSSTDSGEPIYGVEIGQTTRENDVVTFEKFTRLCAGRLSFFDQNGTEVAFISDSRLHITYADVDSLAARSADITLLQVGPYTLTSGRDGHLTLS